MPVRCAVLAAALLAIDAGAQDGKSAEHPPTTKADQKSPASKPPNVMDVLSAGKKVIVFLYQDFNKIDRPNGAFLPGADAARLKDDETKNRATAGGVTRLDVTGDLGDAWASLDVLVEARVDDPAGGDLVLGFQEAQCSKAELRFHDPAWDASEFIPIEPAPIKKDDVASPYVLRLEKPGSYVLRLTLDVEIDRGPVERQLTLTLPRAPVKNVRLRETAVGAGIRIEGARRARTERDIALDADGKTFLPRLLPDESLDVRWRLVAENAGHGSDATYSLVARSRIRGRQLETVDEFAIQARRERREWTVRLPEGESVSGVQVLQNGKSLVATTESLKGAGEETRVKVHTAEAAAGAVKLRLTTYRLLPPLPASPETAVVELSRATLENASGVESFAVVATKDDEDVRVAPAPRPDLGVEPVALGRIEGESPGPRSAAFQYLREDAKLPLRLERLKPILALAAPPNVAIHFDPRATDVQADFRLLVKQGRLESVQATLPASAQDVRATLDGVACSTAAGEERPAGVREWTLAFGERRSGEAVLHLTANISGDARLQRLPIPYLIDVQQAAAMVALTKAPGVQVVLAPDDLKDFQLSSSGTRSGGPTWLSLQTRIRGATLAATVSNIRGKSLAAIEHRLAAAEGNLHVATLIRWENRVEPLTEVRLNIPAAISEVVVRGERLAAPPGGLTFSPGLARLPLAAPAESCAVAVNYTVPLAKDGPTMVPLTTPVADSTTSCFAELRAQSGKRPLPPPNWELTSPERHLAELLEPDNPYVGLLVRADAPPTSLEWRSEAAGSLAEIVVPRVFVDEELTSGGRRRGRLQAALTHRRTPTCELVLPPGCTVSEIYLDGKLAAPIASGRGALPSLTLRLPSDDHSVALEVRYEATCKSFSASRSLALATPKFGGDVVVDQVLWRIATPANCLLASLGEEATAPAPNLWRFDRRLPGEWGFEPGVEDRGDRANAWLEAAAGNLEWPSATPASLQGRRWSFLSWGNAGTLHVVAVREPFWILAVSFLMLAAAAAVRSARRRWRPWVASTIGLLIALVWLMSPRTMSWLWIGGRWALVASVLAGAVWAVRAVANERRRRRAGRRLALVARGERPPAPTLIGPAGSSYKRKIVAE